ncbi:hypothetical protein GIB67_006801 [Kingdonia uniflora]|uniref:Uncharacterized protein n=1 Tax=Kingdonia uniflora TaxID=39325 RepID=A0A7J7KZX8_9MAGN|nr:hypothetical protein GIB67_006801 [Kingdonia uniflora]
MTLFFRAICLSYWVIVHIVMFRLGILLSVRFDFGHFSLEKWRKQRSIRVRVTSKKIICSSSLRIFASLLKKYHKLTKMIYS